VAQGCAEIRWLAGKMGAKPETLSGLSGTGDIMLTCFVNLSRNRTVGVRLGSGESLESILGSMTQVAEGRARRTVHTNQSPAGGISGHPLLLLPPRYPSSVGVLCLITDDTAQRVSRVSHKKP